VFDELCKNSPTHSHKSPVDFLPGGGGGRHRGKGKRRISFEKKLKAPAQETRKRAVLCVESNLTDARRGVYKSREMNRQEGGEGARLREREVNSLQTISSMRLKKARDVSSKKKRHPRRKESQEKRKKGAGGRGRESSTSLGSKRLTRRRCSYVPWKVLSRKKKTQKPLKKI